MSALERLAQLRTAFQPVAEKDGGGCDLWLFPAHGFWWIVEARSTGIVPITQPFPTEKEAREVWDEIEFKVVDA